MSDPLSAVSFDKIDCCPTLERKPVCDRIDVRYQLPIAVGDSRVNLIYHFRLERCSGPLVLGDLANTTTLLPGEQVRLFTSDRHSRWSFDSSTNLAYRHETTSEESFFTFGMARAMSDLTISESGSSSSSYDSDWARGGGGASLNLGFIKIGGGGGGGSYDVDRSSEFARNLSRHAEASSSHVAAGVRASSSTAIGEVERRTHAEGESESHLEASSRTFRNPNQCHAVTYLFYKIAKCQRIRFRLVAVYRSFDDPASPTISSQRVDPDLTGQVLVKPQAVLATDSKRVKVEQAARQAATERQRVAFAAAAGAGDPAVGELAVRRSGLTINRAPIASEIRVKAVDQLDRKLIESGVIDASTKKASDKLVARLSWEREELLPTPGILVRGCLDECNTCEDALRQKVALDLERKELENKLLARQIDLLDKAQEYRCCPEGESEDDGEDG